VTTVNPNGDSAPDHLHLQVNPDNVLKVRAALLAESDRLNSALQHGDYGDWVGLCAGDPLSADARAAFNDRIDEVVAYCRRYADSVRASGDSLEQIAKEYGHTDDEIAASYRRISWGQQGDLA
jgi:hypothetical protein